MTRGADMATPRIEIVDDEIGIGVAVVLLDCGCRRLVWTGSDYSSARREAAVWATALSLPVRDPRRLQ
jgi:hypothetical protein